MKKQENNTTQEIAVNYTNRKKTVSGTDFEFVDKVYRHKRNGKFTYEVVKDLINGVVEGGSETFKTKSAAMNYFHTGEKVLRGEKGVKKYYAVKETWGCCPLEVVASGASVAEAEANAKRELQEEHGGLWVGEFRNCFIGSQKWLEQEFPSGYVRAAIESYEINR